MNIIIRNCTASDFQEVFKLLSQLWPGKKMSASRCKQVYESALNSSNQVFICAAGDGRIIGFCSLTIKNNLWVQGNMAHIDELIVDEQYRGKGIGSRLLTTTEKIAAEKYCKRIELDSSFHRVEAHQFYVNLGFENRAYLFSKTI